MTSTSLDLTSIENLTSYLLHHGTLPADFRKPSKIEKISGGNANFTFRLFYSSRVTTSSGKQVQTAVLKFSANYAAFSKDLALDIDRWNYEKLAFLEVPKTTKAQIPELYFSDDEQHVLIMQDAGEEACTLKELLKSKTSVHPDLANDVGIALADFLRNLHSWGKEEAKLSQFDNKPARVLCAWRTYERLPDTVDSFDTLRNIPQSERETLQEIKDIMQHKMKTDRITVIMGDYWTGNVIVKLSQDRKLEMLYIVDWEMCHPGNPRSDVGQMLAELFCSHSFAVTDENAVSAKLIAKVFCERYKTGNDEFAVNKGETMVEMASHVVTWVKMAGWSSDEQVLDRVANNAYQFMMTGWKMRNSKEDDPGRANEVDMSYFQGL